MCYKRIYISSVFWLLATVAMQAQSFVEAMSKSKAFYEKTTDFSVSIKTALYKTSTDPKPEHVIMGAFAKKGSDFRIDVGPRLFISNAKCGLIVDLQNKLLVYSKPDKQNKQTEELFKEFSNPDSLYRAQVSINALKAQENTLAFEILPNMHSAATGEPERTTITLNKADFSLNTIVYHYKPHPSAPYARIVIKYTNRAGAQAVADKNFSESKYITGKGGKLIPTEEYKDFKLVVQEKIKPQIF